MHTQLSPLAQLGHRAHTVMAAGEALDDASLVDIFIHEISSLPENTPWVLDNFPNTVEQAKASPITVMRLPL